MFDWKTHETTWSRHINYRRQFFGPQEVPEYIDETVLFTQLGMPPNGIHYLTTLTTLTFSDFYS